MRTQIVAQRVRRTIGSLRVGIPAFLIVGVLLWVVAAPVIFLFTSSFRSGTVIDPGAFTLANYETVYLRPQTYTALGNTVIYAGAVTLIGLAIATLFAWLIERTDMPGGRLAWVAMLLPLAIPGMFSSMAWILLLSPNTGLVNVAVRELLSLVGVTLESGPFNIYSLEGMIFVESIRGSTTLFLLMLAAFRLTDPALEEAAQMSGAGPLKTLRKVTLGLLLPALAGAAMYGFIGNLDDLETPLLIGLPAGVFVLPTLIYFTATGGLGAPNYQLAAAYASILVVITGALVWLYYRRVVANSSRFASVTGKAFRPRRASLGKLRYPALGLVGLYFFISTGLPLLVMIWASLLPIYMLPSADAISQLSLDNYAELLADPLIVDSAINSVILAVATATGTMILAFFVSWLVIRERVKFGAVVDGLAFVPHAIPGVAVGIALIVLYLHPALRWTSVYGTLAIIVLALMARVLAFATRSTNAAMTQLGHELEEAAFMSGSGRFKTLARITFPLLLPSFVIGWIWVATYAFRNLTAPLLLAPFGMGTIPTTLYYYWAEQVDYPLAAAMAVAMVGVLSIALLIGRRFLSSTYSEAL